jgi:hypothetical protein
MRWQIYCNQIGPLTGVFEFVDGWAAGFHQQIFLQIQTLRPVRRNWEIRNAKTLFVAIGVSRSIAAVGR